MISPPNQHEPIFLSSLSHGGTEEIQNPIENKGKDRNEKETIDTVEERQFLREQLDVAISALVVSLCASVILRASVRTVVGCFLVPGPLDCLPLSFF